MLYDPGQIHFFVSPSTQSVVIPLTCPPMRVMYRVWSPHVTQLEALKAHGHSALSISYPSPWRAGSLLSQSPRKPEHNRSPIYYSNEPQENSMQVCWPSRSLSGTFRPPRRFLDVSWRPQPAGPALCSLFSDSHIPQIYLWTEKGSAGDREGLRSWSFSSRMGIEPQPPMNPQVSHHCLLQGISGPQPVL